MSERRNDSIEQLFELIVRLRGPDGCPWDREQTLDDILSDLVEEAYELEWARRQHPQGLFEEMGDVLFLVCFAIAVKHETDPEFTIDRIARHAHDKIYNRHPHVFGDAKADTPDESLVHWERIKAEERARKNADGEVLDGVAGNLPPIRLAEKIQERAASVGFDWDDPAGIFAKLREEIDELETSLKKGERAEIKEELGDLLFSVINMTRFLNIDASGALNATNSKFVRRFGLMEGMIHADGKRLPDMTLAEMDEYWTRAKNSP
jgi:tetrapyrrole methylase family protein/MazG family protein